MVAAALKCKCNWREHHWIPDPHPTGAYDFACKHCPAVSLCCIECVGHGEVDGKTCPKCKGNSFTEVSVTHVQGPLQIVGPTTDFDDDIRIEKNGVPIATMELLVDCDPVALATAKLFAASPELRERLTVLVAAIERGEILVHHIESAKRVLREL